MKSTQQGFTLIELVMVIVILGILAATAIPRFVNLAGDAADAALRGVAGSLASGSAINYATRAARNVAADPDVIVTAGNGCTDAIAGALLSEGLPPGYTVAFDASNVLADATALGDTWLCTVDHADATIPPVTWTLHWTN